MYTRMQRKQRRPWISWPWNRHGRSRSVPAPALPSAPPGRVPGSSSSLPFSLQAIAAKVGMDSMTVNYFALFEVISHSFGKCRWPVASAVRRYVVLMLSDWSPRERSDRHRLPGEELQTPGSPLRCEAGRVPLSAGHGVSGRRCRWWVWGTWTQRWGRQVREVLLNQRFKINTFQ